MSEVEEDRNSTKMYKDTEGDNEFDETFQPDEDHALTVFGGVLTIISTIVGGGIVGLPFAFYMLGLVPGLVFMIIMGVQTINSVWLYMRAKDLVPGKPESLYELGYILFQRKAIFMISGILVLNSLGMCMVYFIIFGKTMGGIYAAMFLGANDIESLTGFSHLMTHRIPWISLLAGFLLPIMMKKQLQELHIVSVGLFGAIIIFVIILCFQLVFLGTSEFSKECELASGHCNPSDYTNTPLDFQEIITPGDEATIFKQIKSCVTAMVAFSFANNLFPVYSSLKVKTNVNMAHVSSLSIGLVFVIYTLLSVVCLFLFGEQISKGTNVMNSVNIEILMDPKRKESFVLQLLFMVVLACHIPFIFFSGKEALCIIIDELDRRSISKTLDERIAHLKSQEEGGKILTTAQAHTEGNLESEGNFKENLLTDAKRLGTNITRSSNIAGTRGSIQSQIRSTLQQRKPSVMNTNRESNAGQGNGPRISIIRETQSLRRPPAVTDDEGRKSRMTATGEYEELKEGEDEGGLAYLDMKDKYYYGGSLSYFFLIVFGAITIPQVDTIFEFVGCICINCLSFLFPGSFYLIANARFRLTRNQLIKGDVQPVDYKMLISAYVQIVIGIVAFVLGMMSNIHGLINPE